MILIEKLKLLFNSSKICNRGDCYQGRNCKCSPTFGEAIIDVHALASSIPDADISMELRKVADRLAVLGNRYHDRYGTEKNSVDH
jgi:hypothetical protein